MSAVAEREHSTDFRLPRLRHIPTNARRNGELGREALYIAGEAGLELDEWEAYVLQHSLRLRPDGKWGALEVGLCVPRQNGKGSILEARELVALFIDADRYPNVAAKLTIHSAHEAATAHEGFQRLWDLVEATPRFRAKMRGKPRQSQGGEALSLRDGRRIRFRTRTSGGGRGFSCDLLILDEAMVIADAMHRAVLSTVSARPNSQIWYTGSAVDQDVMDAGVVFSRVRNRGIAGEEDLAYFEWSHDAEHPDQVTPEVARSREVWEQANPGLGIRLSERVVALEQRSLSSRGFAVERLGVGDWPDPESTGKAIDPEKWAAALDPKSEAKDPVCLAFDVSPDRAMGCIAAAGYRKDGKFHIEIIQQGRGTAWIGPLLAELTEKNRPLAVVLDARGAAGALLPKLEEEHRLRVAEKSYVRGGVVPVTSTEMARGCGQLYDAVDQGRLRHLGDPKLDEAVTGALKRPLGDAWAWDKRKSGIDISPLVAATLALWGLHAHRPRSTTVISMAELAEEEEEQAFDPTGLPPLALEDID